MTTKNLKRSFLLLAADLLLGAGEILKDQFGYGTKKTPLGEAEELTDTSAEAPPTPESPEAPPTPESPVDDTPLDENGVNFNTSYCGTAKEPFYKSGLRKGQWKKRKAVEDVTYDKWYAKQKAAATAAAPTNIAAGQFGKPTTGTEKIPETLGEFMAWVAEQQTAGKVTPELVNGAYTATGITFAQVNAPDTAKGAIEVLYRYVLARI